MPTLHPHSLPRLAAYALGALTIATLAACSKPAPSAGSEAEVAERIQKVGRVSLVAARGEARTGEQVFQAQCGACHASGAMGAPKLGDAAAWGARVKGGFDALLASALKGKGQMPPQAGGSASDFEVARAVVYMANAGGAKFPEPKAPEAK
ncbi:MAG: c-type cytochrome [Rhodoferax sp.]